MRSFISSTILAVLLIWISAIPGQSPKLIENKDTIWFAVRGIGEQRLAVDPIANVVDRRILKVPEGCEEADPTFLKFSEKHLRPGQSYHVSFGGAPAGNATVLRPDPNIFNLLASYEGKVRFGGFVRGLATTADLERTRLNHRQAPSPEERASAMRLAVQLYRQAGVRADLLAKIEIENLTHTLLAPSPLPQLIGSFKIQENGSHGDTLVHGLFFVATFDHQRLDPTLTWIKIAPSEAEGEGMRLVDQADLFGDGQDEIVAEMVYYENYLYRIYRRTKDGAHWEQIFETDVLGCL
jgi:hypothetical protein